MNQLQRSLMSVSSAYWYARIRTLDTFEKVKRDFIDDAQMRGSSQAFVWKICRYLDRIEGFSLAALAFDFPFVSGEHPKEMRIIENAEEKLRIDETRRNEGFWK